LRNGYLGGIQDLVGLLCDLRVERSLLFRRHLFTLKRSCAVCQRTQSSSKPAAATVHTLDIALQHPAEARFGLALIWSLRHVEVAVIAAVRSTAA
jgi:hypothetical protein